MGAYTCTCKRWTRPPRFNRSPDRPFLYPIKRGSGRALKVPPEQGPETSSRNDVPRGCFVSVPCAYACAREALRNSSPGPVHDRVKQYARTRVTEFPTPSRTRAKGYRVHDGVFNRPSLRNTRTGEGPPSFARRGVSSGGEPAPHLHDGRTRPDGLGSRGRAEEDSRTGSGCSGRIPEATRRGGRDAPGRDHAPACRAIAAEVDHVLLGGSGSPGSVKLE